MRKLIIAPLLAASLLCKAQGPADNLGSLPSVIPPSPDVASLVKIGSMSTSLHTGSANVNIPLYELSIGSLKMPIALSYSTNGTRTNDIASRVGLGWNLVAGGSISRTIHDEEDGGASTIPLTPPNFGQLNQAVFDYCFYANQEHYDTERDEYAFSVNGISGKFFFDAGGVIRVAEHTNIKITKQGDLWTLITGEGMTYEFGGTIIEKTRDVKTNGNQRAHKIKTTAWFLKRIITPEGDQVNFSYTAIYTQTKLGPFQSVILKPMAGGYPNEPNASCAAFCGGQFSSVGINRVDYDTYFLNSITTTNGQEITFSYEDRPDASEDNRITGIEVKANIGLVISKIKTYQLEYEDVPFAGDLNQRFFLKKLITKSVGTEIPQETLVHELIYNSPATLGGQESIVQDYYGYSRNINFPPPGNSTDNFFPRPLNYNDYEFGYLGVSRAPVAEAARAGTLHKVIYPTGGYEEFIYEPHTINEDIPVTTTVYNNHLNMNGTGDGFSGTNTFTQQFTIANGPVQISYLTEWNTLGPPPGPPPYWEPDDIHFISYLEIWRVATNTLIFEERHKLYGTTTHSPTLQPGVLYEVRLKVVSNSHRSFVTIGYNPSIQTVLMPNAVAVCGLRVQRINSFDPVNNKTTTKYYTYESLTSPGVSTGRGVISPSFQAGYHGGGVCHEVIGERIYPCPPGLIQVNSSTLGGSFTFNGSPVAYTHVIESDHPTFVNGGIEHNFYTYFQPQQPLAILNHDIAGASSAGPFPDMNGAELGTTVFKKLGNSVVKLKETVNTYSYNNPIGYTITNYVTRKRWNPPGQVNWSYPDRLQGYDVNSYIYMSKWQQLDKTITTQYDQNGLNPMVEQVEYQYNNTVHLQPTQILTANSKGESIVQQMKYPVDVPGAVTSGMIAKNIITPVIESNTTNNGNPVSLVYTEYAAWQSNSFYKPQLVKIKKGSATLEPRLRFYNYDPSGNPLEVAKENDQHISYLWNYKKTFPVAEIKNASANDVFYTSFEGDDQGHWTYTPAEVEAGGVTGLKSYTGTISCNVSRPANYIATVWTTAGQSPSLNNTQGTLITSRNGWNLYKWNIHLTGSVDLVGTHFDEVRLYPANAQMTTYTYQPFTGITSICDVNNRIVYYEYDNFNRLKLVKDEKGNILKRMEYKYRVTPQE